MKIRIRDVDFDVELPALDLREDLVYSYGAKWKSNRTGMPLQRVCCAALALSIPEIAFGLRVLTNPRDDLYGYGAEIYNHLRERGWKAADVLTAGDQVLKELLTATFPREHEVKKAQGNSEGGVASSEKPSASP